MNKHTPTPWKVGYNDGSGFEQTEGIQRNVIAYAGNDTGLPYGLKGSDAEFIVRVWQ